MDIGREFFGRCMMLPEMRDFALLLKSVRASLIRLLKYLKDCSMMWVLSGVTVQLLITL